MLHLKMVLKKYLRILLFMIALILAPLVLRLMFLRLRISLCILLMLQGLPLTDICLVFQPRLVVSLLLGFLLGLFGYLLTVLVHLLVHIVNLRLLKLLLLLHLQGKLLLYPPHAWPSQLASPFRTPGL